MLSGQDNSEKGESGGLSGISAAFLEHATFLKRFLAKFLRNEQDIEDVAHEAYLKAYSAERDRGVIEHPKAFLFSIAKNLALNELSRKSRQLTDYIEDCQPSTKWPTADSIESEVEADESIGLYCEAVANLPEKCRRVYLLRKVQGKSHREISEQLGITRSAVEKHLYAGVLSCRKYMQPIKEEQTKQFRATGEFAVEAKGEKSNG